MKKQHKKNAPTGAATSAGAKLEAGTEQATTSTSNDTTPAPPGQGLHITDFLCAGQAHATPLRDLVSLTGQDGRTVRLEIELARRQGIPILSNSKDGYWLGENKDEIAQFVRGMKHRARQIQLTADAVGKAAGIGK